jgi:preprotein translocase subunit SecD
MKKIFYFLIIFSFISAGCNSGRGSLKKTSDLPQTYTSDYIQVKIEDRECSSGCDVEDLPGSDGPVCFKKIPVLTADDIVEASSVHNNSGHGYIIALELNSTGQAKLHIITRENRGKRLGIYIEGKFVTAPVIYSVISDGKAAIAGGFSEKEAHSIALKLNAGKKN